MGSGCFAQDDGYCNNDYENFYRDILKTFPKQIYSQLKYKIDKLIIDNTSQLNTIDHLSIDNKISSENHKTIKNNYLLIKNSMVNQESTNKLTLFHKEIIPTYTTLYSLHYKNNLKANFLIWLIPFSSNSISSRIEIINDCYYSFDKNKNKDMTIDFLLEFIESHIKICLLYNSEAFIKYLTYLVLNNSADATLLNESEEIKKKLFEKGNLNSFIKSVVNQLNVLINNSEDKSNTIELNDDLLKSLDKTLPFLFDPVLLRYAFYKSIYNK
jgi:hypothetical protein